MTLLRRLIPPFLKPAIRFAYVVVTTAPSFYLDWKRFFLHSRVLLRSNTQGKWRSRITVSYHSIEKGLSLKNSRPGFGKDLVANLIHDIAGYESLYGADHISCAAKSCLINYFRFNDIHGTADSELYDQFQKLQPLLPNNIQKGGTTEVSKTVIQEGAKGDYWALVHSRHSVRQFDSEKVAPCLIEDAVKLAQMSPSACNRQASKVYAFFDEVSKAGVLALQNGNRGFGNQAGAVLIVTADLQDVQNATERHLCWIDGGMFAMSLVYGLHFLGLGTCCLNWSVAQETDKKQRAIAGIPDNEVIIMLVAVGHLCESFNVTHSPRKPLQDTLKHYPIPNIRD